MPSHPLQGGHEHPHFTDDKTEARTQSNYEEASGQQPGPGTAAVALLSVVSVPHSQSPGPSQGMQPRTPLTPALRASHTPEGTPTEHEGEEGVVAQQQHDAQHRAEAVPRGALLQLQQPVVLGHTGQAEAR